MIGTFVAAAALSATSCPGLAVDDKLVQQMSLVGTGRTLTASTYTHPGLGPFDIAATRLLVHSSKCELLFQQEFEGTTEINLTTITLGKTPMLVATMLSPGGSGCGLYHILLAYDGYPRIFAPTDLSHDNMGGFFVGDLGRGRGPGLVLFDALWGSGSHYDPHPYRVWTYRWKDQRFVGPVVLETKPMTPDPKQVAKALGYPFSDEMNTSC
jgi:hypothetical protein